MTWYWDKNVCIGPFNALGSFPCSFEVRKAEHLLMKLYKEQCVNWETDTCMSAHAQTNYRSWRHSDHQPHHPQQHSKYSGYLRTFIHSINFHSFFLKRIHSLCQDTIQKTNTGVEENLCWFTLYLMKRGQWRSPRGWVRTTRGTNKRCNGSALKKFFA